VGKSGRSKTHAELRAYCAAGLTLLLMACNLAPPTKIKQILDHPRQFDGHEVTVEGQVEESANLLVLRYFVLKDETGEITVITPKAVPTRGERIRVRGRVNQAFAFQDKSLIVIVEDSND
jgi:aspartyl/asparaginyl-tRNA synthetase